MSARWSEPEPLAPRAVHVEQLTAGMWEVQVRVGGALVQVRQFPSRARAMLWADLARMGLPR